MDSHNFSSVTIDVQLPWRARLFDVLEAMQGGLFKEIIAAVVGRKYFCKKISHFSPEGKEPNFFSPSAYSFSSSSTGPRPWVKSPRRLNSLIYEEWVPIIAIHNACALLASMVEVQAVRFVKLCPACQEKPLEGGRRWGRGSNKQRVRMFVNDTCMQIPMNAATITANGTLRLFLRCIISIWWTNIAENLEAVECEQSTGEVRSSPSFLLPLLDLSWYY